MNYRQAVVAAFAVLVCTGIGGCKKDPFTDCTSFGHCELSCPERSVLLDDRLAKR